ncbi:MAG TPA: hypothetical protein VEH76_06500, partial [Methylocystis sp.]|nr:hypothetical protein [Methylocystis sp.]
LEERGCLRRLNALFSGKGRRRGASPDKGLRDCNVKGREQSPNEGLVEFCDEGRGKYDKDDGDKYCGQSDRAATCHI